MHRKALFVALASFGAVACTQVLNIEDRSLRPTTESAGDANVGADDSGLLAEGGQPLQKVDGGTITISSDPAHAVFPTTPLDFGPVSCGGGAPANRTLVINNVGDSDLDFQAELGPTSSFSLIGATAGPIAGRSYATITIASSGFPLFATASQTEAAALTVTILIDGQSPVTQQIDITETAAGGSLLLDPGIAAFGQAQVGTAASALPISLKNTGNVAMTVSFGASTDSQFSLMSDAGSAMLGPGESVSGLTAQFLPSSAISSTGSITITAAGAPMCGASPDSLHLSGAGTVGPITVQPGSLDFGLVDCGSTTAAKQITMSTTGAAFSWSASLGKGAASPYTISPVSGTATAGLPVIVTVTPHAVPATSAITADLYADNLTIVAADGPHVIPLHETAAGAILSQSLSSVAFGGVNSGTKATSSFNVVNAGNEPATISYTIVNGAFALAPQGQTLSGDGYSSSATVTFSPTSATAYAGSATMTVAAGTVLCAPLPAALPLTGTGTINYVTVTPSSLDFGLVNCGSKGSSKSVVVSNTAPGSGSAFNWTASLGKGSGSPYSLALSSGNIKPGKNISLTISPSTIPQTSPTTSDYYADTLTITTDAANDPTPHVISLHETAQGVILTLSPSVVAFGSVAGGSSSSLPFQIINNGNVPAHVGLALGFGGFFYFSVDPSSGLTVNGGTSVAGTASFQPSKGPVGAKSTTITPSFSQVNCGGPLQPTTLSGTGI
ncbi:MAG: choice-of-anchor D domain-containing protein [Polyangiaceae bacterium]